VAGALARVRSVMESSPFLRHVLTLVSGTATAQAIVFGMTMILTRIFSDADLGQLTRYTSVVSIITAVAALRYDMTIMLPKKDAWALACARLGMVCIVVVSIISSVVALLLKPLVTRYWGADIAAWMPLLGVTTLLLSTVQLLQYWYNRQSDYRTISINRVEQQVGQSLGQLVLGMAGMVSVGGLLIGQTIGQAWAFVNLGRKAKPLHRPLPPEAPTLWQGARRHRRRPPVPVPAVRAADPAASRRPRSSTDCADSSPARTPDGRPAPSMSSMASGPCQRSRAPKGVRLPPRLAALREGRRTRCTRRAQKDACAFLHGRGQMERTPAAAAGG